MASFENIKRVVVKVGTSTLTHKTGLLNIRRVELLVKILADLKNSGRDVILVSSGAIGVGVGELGLKSRPTDTPSKQACAAIGQCELMYMYDKLFSQYNHKVAQVLLTRDIVERESRKENVVNTFNRLLDFNVIPVVNENDTVSVEELELEFGDNDTLSAIVGELVDADLLLILSDIDGLYDQNPRECPDAHLIHQVEAVTETLREAAGGKGSSLGTGGMVTKLNAAQIALEAGFPMVLLNGQNPEQIYDLFAGKEVGTIFGPGLLSK
ncbi:MAG: glutamate 5-kinase [Massiliimalia sp.]